MRNFAERAHEMEVIWKAHRKPHKSSVRPKDSHNNEKTKFCVDVQEASKARRRRRSHARNKPAQQQQQPEQGASQEQTTTASHAKDPTAALTDTNPSKDEVCSICRKARSPSACSLRSRKNMTLLWGPGTMVNPLLLMTQTPLPASHNQLWTQFGCVTCARAR